MAAEGPPIIDILLPTYRIEPGEKEKFYPSIAKAIADKIITEEMEGREFEEEDSKDLSLNISNRIREAVQESLSKTRFKVVVQTVVGQMKDQGVRIASRCLWDPVTDNYSSSHYTSQSMFCSVLVFALYTD